MVTKRVREIHSRSLPPPVHWNVIKSGSPVIMLEQPTETCIAPYLTFIKQWGRVNDRLVAKSLVRTLVVIVFDIHTDEMIKMLRAYRDEMIKALVFQ
jgi:hypothetical protein